MYFTLIYYFADKRMMFTVIWENICIYFCQDDYPLWEINYIFKNIY